MKKIIRDVIIAIILVFGPIFVFNLYSGDYSNHIFSDADNITSGELNAARLDHSSVAFKNELYSSMTVVENSFIVVDDRFVVIETNFATGTVTVNLIITTASLDSNDWVVTADAITVMGDYQTDLATTCRMDHLGLGGTDLVGEVPSTWYGLYVISNGSTMSVLASTATGNNSPTMPTGFTKWRRIGSVYNGATSALQAIIQAGNIITLQIRRELIQTADLATEPAVYDYSNDIPPNATVVYFYVVYSATAASAGFVFRNSGTVRADAGTNYAAYADGGDAAPVGETLTRQQIYKIHVIGNKEIIYYETVTGIGFFNVSIIGWEI